MRVVVGSTNPVKRRAVARALPDATVELADVDSGVAEQPVGAAETIRGAENRARRALAAVDDAAGAAEVAGPDAAGPAAPDLGVGLEGGVAEREAVPGLWLVMWAAATDGRRWGRGTGPSLRLPDDVAARVRAGEALGPVMDDLTGTAGVGRGRGAVGVLTDGALDREAALAAAAAGALASFRDDGD